MLKWRRHVVQNVRWYDFRNPEPSILHEDGDVYLQLRARSWPDAGTIDSGTVRIKIPMITGS